MEPFNEHPDNLAEFVEGVLSDDEASQIITHLGECEACLDIVDTLWADNRSLDMDKQEIPSLDQLALARVEGRVLRQIHRSDLSGRALWFGTAGLVDTYLKMLPSMGMACLAILRPFLALGESARVKKDIRHD